jgi:hypothetical protein
VRIRDETSHAAETVHGPGGFVEELDDLGGERHAPGYLGREERPEPSLGLAHVAPGAGSEGVWLHRDSKEGGVDVRPAYLK